MYYARLELANDGEERADVEDALTQAPAVSDKASRRAWVAAAVSDLA